MPRKHIDTYQEWIQSARHFATEDGNTEFLKQALVDLINNPALDEQDFLSQLHNVFNNFSNEIELLKTYLSRKVYLANIDTTDPNILPKLCKDIANGLIQECKTILTFSSQDGVKLEHYRGMIDDFTKVLGLELNPEEKVVKTSQVSQLLGELVGKFTGNIVGFELIQPFITDHIDILTQQDLSNDTLLQIIRALRTLENLGIHHSNPEQKTIAINNAQIIYDTVVLKVSNPETPLEFKQEILAILHEALISSTFIFERNAGSTEEQKAQVLELVHNAFVWYSNLAFAELTSIEFTQQILQYLTRIFDLTKTLSNSTEAVTEALANTNTMSAKIIVAVQSEETNALLKPQLLDVLKHLLSKTTDFVITHGTNKHKFELLNLSEDLYNECFNLYNIKTSPETADTIRVLKNSSLLLISEALTTRSKFYSEIGYVEKARNLASQAEFVRNKANDEATLLSPSDQLWDHHIPSCTLPTYPLLPSKMKLTEEIELTILQNLLTDGKFNTIRTASDEKLWEDVVCRGWFSSATTRGLKSCLDGVLGIDQIEQFQTTAMLYLEFITLTSSDHLLPIVACEYFSQHGPQLPRAFVDVLLEKHPEFLGNNILFCAKPVNFDLIESLFGIQLTSEPLYNFNHYLESWIADKYLNSIIESIKADPPFNREVTKIFNWNDQGIARSAQQLFEILKTSLTNNQEKFLHLVPNVQHVFTALVLHEIVKLSEQTIDWRFCFQFFLHLQNTLDIEPQTIISQAKIQCPDMAKYDKPLAYIAQRVTALDCTLSRASNIFSGLYEPNDTAHHELYTSLFSTMTPDSRSNSPLLTHSNVSPFLTYDTPSFAPSSCSYPMGSTNDAAHVQDAPVV